LLLLLLLLLSCLYLRATCYFFQTLEPENGQRFFLKYNKNSANVYREGVIA